MKIDMVQSELPNMVTNTEPNKFKIEIVAIGRQADSERFYNYVSRYELLKQKDIAREYYQE